MSHQIMEYEDELMKLWGLVNELSGNAHVTRHC